MKAWRFYGFGDMRLDDVAEPTLCPGHVIVEPLCVQPSVTEAQWRRGFRRSPTTGSNSGSKPKLPCSSLATNSAPAS
jgi:hypothetical protein